MTSVLKIAIGSGTRPVTSPGARHKAVVQVLAVRMMKVFPELNSLAGLTKTDLETALAQYVKITKKGRAQVDPQGIASYLWDNFSLRVENPTVFNLALGGEIKQAVPGIIAIRLQPQEAKPLSGPERESKLAKVNQLLQANGKLTQAAIDKQLAWANSNLPDAYFKTCSSKEIASHLQQISVQNDYSEFRDNHQATYIIRQPSGNLVPILDALRKAGQSVKRARVYYSNNRDLAIFIFETGAQKRVKPTAAIKVKISEFKRVAEGVYSVVGKRPHQITAKEIDAFIGSLSHDYLIDSPVPRLLHHLELYLQASSHDKEAAVEVDHSPAGDCTRVTLIGNHLPKVGFLLKLVRVFQHHQLELQQVFVETLENEATTRAIRLLSAQIGDTEPCQALVEILIDAKWSPAKKKQALQAVRSWGEASIINGLLAKLFAPSEEEQKFAFDTLVSRGRHVQEATAINTFYVTKQKGEALDERLDAQLIEQLKSELKIARWSFGDEFVDLQARAQLNIQQTNLVAAIASFTQEMASYVRPKDNPLSWAEVKAVFLRNPSLTRILVERFEMAFTPAFANFPFIDLPGVAQYCEIDFAQKLEQSYKENKNNLTQEQIAQEKAVAGTAMAFVRAVRATNYYAPTSSLAFSLDGDFARQIEVPGLGGAQGVFPATPFGIFYLCNADFRGFHIRFEDIARGGIRIMPHDAQRDSVFERNTLIAFAENYRLAETQDDKNIMGEIPEGGAKGVIVLKKGADPVYAFQSYLDGLLDMVVGTRTLLFLGPDEGTGTEEFMDAGADQAARRGYRSPRTITTGKSKGGTAHDKFGITTTGVYEFERLIFAARNLHEPNLTKVQTGGPDGDLGSNELKVSQAKTIGLVDGFGVAYDPAGLNHDELLRLAAGRKSIAKFDPNKLAPGGFVVADKNDATLRPLPNGQTVSGNLLFGDRKTNFTTHLLFQLSADVLLPAGGKQQTINKDNVHLLLNKDGTPKYLIIVEGANVFIIDEARQILEEAGVILIKDASANKGGVMCSSHDVLTSFLLAPEEFESIHPEYVEQIKERIRASVQRGFDLLEKLKDQPDIKYRSTASDLIGREMKRLFRCFMASDLPTDPIFDNLILSHLMPAIVNKLGRDETVRRLARVPENYRRAIVAARLASGIVYREGLGRYPNEQDVSPQTLLDEASHLISQKAA